MITNVAQRWREGRDGFVIDMERGVFDPRGYEVVHARSHVEAKAFVERHHYSKTWRGGGEVFELRHGSEVVGAGTFAQPGGPAVLGAWFPGHEKTSLELSRFVLLQGVPFNAETWMMARARELLWREGYTGIISFSDPMPRDLASGGFIFAGHVGTIYAASSAVYTGQTREETQWLFADGTVFSPRLRTKIRAFGHGDPLARCAGWASAVEVLLAHGAPPFTFEHGDTRAVRWCDEALAKLARRRRHPGQHRYLWAKRGGARRDLDRQLDKKGVGQMPYPRVTPEILAAKLNMASKGTSA